MSYVYGTTLRSVPSTVEILTLFSRLDASVKTCAHLCGNMGAWQWHPTRHLKNHSGSLVHFCGTVCCEAVCSGASLHRLERVQPFQFTGCLGDGITMQDNSPKWTGCVLGERLQVYTIVSCAKG